MAGFDNIKDKGLVSRRGEELLKSRQERLEQRSVGEMRILDRIKQQEDEISSVLADATVAYENRLAQAAVLGKKVDALRKGVSRLEGQRSYSANKQFIQSAHTALGQRSMTENITNVSRSIQNLGTSLSMARSSSTFELEQQGEKARSLLKRQQPRILEAAQSVGEDNGERFKTQMRIQDRLIRQAGLSDAALRAQKKLGLDTGSQFFNAQHTVGRVREQQEAAGIKEDVAAGRVGSRAEVQQQLDITAQRLIDTFSKLSEAIENNTSDAKDLGEEFQELESSYKRHQNILREIDKTSGGGGRSALQAAGGIVSDIGVITQGIGAIYKNNYITSEMQQTQNRMGYAQLSNQRFEDVYGAGGGDMAALRRVMSQQYSDQAARGAEYRDRGQFATGITTAGVGIKTAGTGIDTATEAGTIWQAAKGTFLGGGAGAAVGIAANIGAKMTPDVMQFNQSMTDYRKDLTAGQSDISAQQQYRAYQDEKFKVRDFGAQQGMDYYKQLGLATRGFGIGSGVENSRNTRNLVGTGRGLIGSELDTDIDQSVHSSIVSVLNEGAKRMGGGYSPSEKNYMRAVAGGKNVPLPSKYASPLQSRIVNGEEFNVANGKAGGGGNREDVMSALMDPEVLKRLSSNSGIGMKDIPSILSGFKGAIGKDFTANGMQGIESEMARAGNAARVGYLDSTSQYIQARGQLTGIGGGSDDLEKIMKQAVAAGMDSSKNIMEMVGAVQELNSVSASAGINSTMASTEMLGRSIGDLRAQGVSKNMATRAARKGAAAVSDFGTSGEMDIFNIMEMSGLRKDFKNAEMWELDALQQADPKELEQMLRLFKSGKKGDKEKAQQLAESRGLGGQLTDAKSVGKALNRSRQQVAGRQVGLGMDVNLEQEYQKMLNENIPASEWRPELRNFINARTNQTVDRGTNGIAMASALQSGRNAKTENLKIGPQGATTFGGEEALAAPGVRDAAIFEQSAKMLAEAAQNLKDLGSIQKDVAAGTNLTQVYEETQKAAEAMKGPVDTFSGAMPKFNKTIGDFTSKMDTLIDKMDRVIKNKTMPGSLQGQGQRGKKR